ncbi:ABC transporter substrate-binding protein [Xylophilus sp.]|uniref:ABC transporter substrate-binding protein n=1 Tax=Xylophilus sp. TaxID=2653893 RepID=UPI0013B74B8D|nr:ABC transporter substrate-binding protein [Xylophilus sp.]KAF1050029.1 MAG: Periplasmic dipeptide transport protein [Xylophilus sp.]
MAPRPPHDDDAPARPGPRRRAFVAAAGGGAALALAWPGVPHAQAAAGARQLVIAQEREPTGLAGALIVSGATASISSKIFDTLVGYDAELRPVPRLAQRWQASRDGLAVTFWLQPAARWHDGRPVQAQDVAFSALEIWRKYHARGRVVFADLAAADTPDAQTVRLRFARPVPYLLAALADAEVLPRHRYEKAGDPLANPANSQPVGSGPWRFVRWDRGSHVLLERNPAYWAAGRPRLDKLFFRFFPDPAAAAAALETRGVQLSYASLSPTDVTRLQQVPALEVEKTADLFNTVVAFEFNLDRPALRDLRVRQAFAHAIDRSFLHRHVWQGWADLAEAPVPPALAAFQADAVPRYAFDLQRAEALLEAAGLQRDARGVRLSLVHVVHPAREFVQASEYLRGVLARIGVRLKLRSPEWGAYIHQLYTRRDFDTATIMTSVGPDPAIGLQRLYWSKNFQPGVAFSNATHYASPEADALLEQAQAEADTAKRRALYARFQVLAMTDLPRIPLVAPRMPVVHARSLRDAAPGPESLPANLASAGFAAAG